MSTFVLHTNPRSRGRIAHWMIAETGASYDVVYVGYGPEMKGPEYRAINPLGKVPALTHGDRIVTECAAICAYLADAVPEAGLAPPPADRADYYRWLFFASGPLEAAIINRAFGFEVPEPRRASVGYGAFGEMMDALEQAVGRHPFVAGDTFTAADVYVGSQVGWGLEFNMIEDRPAFRQYWSRLQDRPARRKAEAADDAATADAPAAG